MEERDLREIADNIAVLIDSRNDALIRNITVDLHPADLADILHHLRDDDRDYMFGLLDVDVASDVMPELDDVSRDDILEDLKHERLTEIVDEMDSDDAADLVSDLPDHIAEKVLAEIDKEDSAEVRELLRHDEETAGGIMAKEFVSVDQSSTVDEAIRAIRKKREEVEELYNVYVTDQDQRLVGVLSLKTLVLSGAEKRVSDVMLREVVAVKTTVDQEEVVNLAKRYDLVSIPVIDEKEKLVGRITFDDLVDVMEDEASEDIQRMAGVSGEEEFREMSPFRIVRSRLPWLFVGFVGELLSALILRHHEASIEQITAAAFFIPIMMAIPGNIGIQAATIIVRGMATGEIAVYHMGRLLLREVSVALINGLTFSILIFGVISFWLHTPRFGAVLAIILLANVISASLFGSMIPIILKKMKIDPATATGPFITTSNDALGLLIYLSLITLLLPWI